MVLRNTYLSRVARHEHGGPPILHVYGGECAARVVMNLTSIVLNVLGAV